MGQRYRERQTACDQEYDHAYRAWVSSLTTTERAALAKEGLDVPDLAPPRQSPYDPSIALSICGTRDDFQEDSSKDLTGGDDGLDCQMDAAAAIASFCARIRAHPSPLLAFDAACYAVGLMEVEGLSETALARRHRVTRACFNKAVIQFSDTLGLRPSLGMRSKLARLNHRIARLQYLDGKGMHSNGNEPQ